MSAATQVIGRMDSEAGVIKQAQRGNGNAFADIYHAHKPRVYSLCLRMTNNVAEAEDLTQEAFLQVFRKLPTFRGDSALSTWMYRVAVNTVLMYFRKRKRPQQSLDEPANPNTRNKTREYGFEDQRLTTSIDRIALARAIKDLPDGYRTIFLLHEVEGYEHREIARMLKCSVGNSKSQLHKARLKMREIMSHASEISAPDQQPKALRQGPSVVSIAGTRATARTGSSATRQGKTPQVAKPVFILPTPQPSEVGIAA